MACRPRAAAPPARGLAPRPVPARLPARTARRDTRHVPASTPPARDSADASAAPRPPEGGSPPEPGTAPPPAADKPAPDMAAAANLLLSLATVWGGGWLLSVDPWALYRGDPGPALALGATLALPHAAFLTAVRAALGGTWWSEVDGQGALGEVPAPRGLTFAACVALADGAVWRGLVLNFGRAVVSAPLGGVGGGVGGAARSALELWEAGADRVDAAMAAAAGTLTLPTPLPPQWLAPVLALAVGAVASAVASWEPPGDYSCDTEGPEAPPLKVREILWAYWREEEAAEAMKKGGGAGPAAAGEVGTRPPPAAPASPTTAVTSPPWLPRDNKPIMMPPDGDLWPEWDAEVSAVVARRWPAYGAEREWIVPALVGLEAAGLAGETLATGSLLASVTTHGLGLAWLWWLERRAHLRAGGGGAGGDGALT